MTALLALVIAGAYWLTTVLAVILAARFGVVSLHVRRPPKPRKPKEAGNG